MCQPMKMNGCALVLMGGPDLSDPLAVEPLIRLLGAAQRQVQPDAGWGLNMITMASIGDDPQKWREWWQENKEVCTKFNEMERELMTKASAELLERRDAPQHHVGLDARRPR